MGCKLGDTIYQILRNFGAFSDVGYAHTLARAMGAICVCVAEDVDPKTRQDALDEVRGLVKEYPPLGGSLELVARMNDSSEDLAAPLAKFAEQYGPIKTFGRPIKTISPAKLRKNNYAIIREYLSDGDWETFVQQQTMGDCEAIARKVGERFGLAVCFGVLDVDHAFLVDHTLDDDYDPDADAPEDEVLTTEVWHYWNETPDGRILDFAKGTVKDLMDGIDLSNPLPDRESRYHLENNRL